MEGPRLILPFTVSIALPQDADSSPDDSATPDPNASADEAATQDSTTVGDAQAAASAATSIPDPAILRAIDVHGLQLASDLKMNGASAAEGPKTYGRLQANSPKKIMDLVSSPDTLAPLSQTGPFSQTAQLAPAVPADPSTPILPSASSEEQAAAVVQNNSTIVDATYTASTSTSDRTIAYRSRASNERPAETNVVSRASRAPQDVSDSTQAVPAAVAVPVPPVTQATNASTNAVEPQYSNRPTGSNTPRQGAKALESGSAVSQDSSAAAGTDSSSTLPSGIEPTDNTTAASNAGAIAFAARLTSATDLQPAASESSRPPEALPGPQNPQQSTSPVAAKQLSMESDLPSDSRSGGGSQFDKERASDLFAKPEALLPQIHVAVADQPAIPANNHSSAAPVSPAAHMDQVVDPPAAAPKTNNDITVRIPDSTDQGTAVRFVERAGEIHVSVRTGDVEMAQSLRGGLDDLVNHLQDGGLRTELWQPGSGSNGATSQNDSHQPFADPDGSNGRQYSSGSNSGQESKQQNKPRWAEELEGSIGNQNFKETQLLWQA